MFDHLNALQPLNEPSTEVALEAGLLVSEEDVNVITVWFPPSVAF